MRTSTKKLRLGAAFAACGAIACILIAANSPAGSTAQSSSAESLIDALPTGASTLVYIDLAAIRASSFYEHRPDKSPLTVPNQDYEDFVRSTGFDFEKDLDRAVVGSWPAPSEKEQRKNIAIAEGRFDRAKIQSYAASHGKIDHQRGREVFQFPASAGGGWNSAVFLDERHLALVSGQSVDALFAARSAAPAAAADPIRDRASRLDGAAAFAITHVAPAPGDDAGTGPLQGVPNSQLMALARSVRWVTFAARPEGDNLRVSMEGECDTDGDARQLQSALELLRVLGRVGLESPKTRESLSPAALASLQTLLKTAEVTQTAERVRVLLELTPQIFEAGPSPNQGKQP
jgi:hypothetical protein